MKIYLFIVSIVIALSIYTAYQTVYGTSLLEVDGVFAPNAFHETEYILQYCSEHASDSPNPVQDLVDKLKITWAYFDGETCTSVKQFHDAYLGKDVEKENYFVDLVKLNYYCFEHADRAALGQNVGNDLVKSGLVSSTFYDWSCSKIQEELQLQRR